MILFYQTETSTNLLNTYKLDKKSFLENHNAPFGKKNKNCATFEVGPYIVTKVITNVNHETAVDADPTRTQVVDCNHLVEYLLRDNELSNLLSKYEKAFNDDKTEYFCKEFAKNRLSIESANRLIR